MNSPFPLVNLTSPRRKSVTSSMTDLMSMGSEMGGKFAFLRGTQYCSTLLISTPK